MADLSITAANVKLISGRTRQLTAGVTLAAGQLAYVEATSSKAKLSDNDSATAEVRAVAGITLNGAAVDQPVIIALNGAEIDVGVILTKGVEYYLSGTPGGLCPRADVLTTDDLIRVGIALSTSRLKLDIADPDITL